MLFEQSAAIQISYKQVELEICEYKKRSENPWYLFFNNWRFLLPDDRFKPYGYELGMMHDLGKWDIPFRDSEGPLGNNSKLYLEQTPRILCGNVRSALRAERIKGSQISILQKEISSDNEENAHAASIKLHLLTYGSYVRLRARGYNHSDLIC